MSLHRSLAFARAVEHRLLSTVSGKMVPVNRVYCVGRNYWDHAIEMGANPEREPPFFFNKPGDAVVDTQRFPVVPYPSLTAKFAYECELVVVIGRGGRDISVESAPKHIFGYGVGCDLTRRDLQDTAKQMKRPWCFSKGFDFSAPIGPITPIADAGDLASKNMKFTVNGEVKQEASLTKMIWNCAEQISYLSKAMSLYPGDIIMTGTPAGVGVLSVGDKCHASVDGLEACTFTVSDTLGSDAEASETPESVLAQLLKRQKCAE